MLYDISCFIKLLLRRILCKTYKLRTFLECKKEVENKTMATATTTVTATMTLNDGDNYSGDNDEADE